MYSRVPLTELSPAVNCRAGRPRASMAPQGKRVAQRLRALTPLPMERRRATAFRSCLP